MHKSFAITERQKVEFRLSAFNLFNHSLIWAFGGQWQFSGVAWEVHLPTGAIVRPVEIVKAQMKGGQSIYTVFLKLGQKKNWWQFWKG